MKNIYYENNIVTLLSGGRYEVIKRGYAGAIQDTIYQFIERIVDYIITNIKER